MSYPLISVIIPTYNHAEFLKRSLKSVVDQTYQNLEVIVIDNHSNDNTDDVVYMFSDPRIHLLKIHNNGVIAVSRNLGISNCNGQWIAFLDSDDFWLPTKIEVCLKYINNSSYDVVSHDELMVFSANKSSTLLRHGPYTHNFYPSLLIYGNRLSPSATLIRHRFLQEHNILFNESPDFTTVEDYDLWMNLARLHARFCFIPTVLGEYVIHDGNCSAKFNIHFSNLQNLLQHHVKFVQTFSSNQTHLWSRIQVRLSIIRIKHSFSNCEINFALLTLLKLIYSSPLHLFLYFGHVFNKNIKLCLAKFKS